MSNVIPFNVFQVKALEKSLTNLRNDVNTKYQDYKIVTDKHGPDSFWTTVPELIAARKVWQEAWSNYSEVVDRISNLV